MNLPSYYTIVSGKGFGKYALTSFDNALLDAGVGDYNLIKVSSILPARCQYKSSINLEKGRFRKYRFISGLVTMLAISALWGEHVTGPYEGQPNPPLEVVVVTLASLAIWIM